ncbi:SRPBCC family protein [Pseudomonas vanderleydeniana]|uniref:SRPBCC family protein n=1 Tax=Pseudomonas vanderleydeniana TaxID=2745495 RepID=A0A9E6TRD8_9PSED|nr:SRPBCC family protein [Pseudomonas vanderleydeniana]QXI27371.1 SRPBCC family protein [Pseudomonas vanderleydeniana]
MSSLPFQTMNAEYELSISRLLEAPRNEVFRAWTEPALLARWWGPHGMTTPVCEMQLWVGGLFRTVMRAPDGSEYPYQGVFLEIAAPERIVFTDAFAPGWTPTGKPFMTARITLEEAPGGTLYTASAMHWSAAERDSHEQMGFHQGWGESLDRLALLLEQGLPD